MTSPTNGPPTLSLGNFTAGGVTYPLRASTRVAMWVVQSVPLDALHIKFRPIEAEFDRQRDERHAFGQEFCKLADGRFGASRFTVRTTVRGETLILVAELSDGAYLIDFSPIQESEAAASSVAAFGETVVFKPRT